ncbi:DUF1127 domain-containing protein [Taklimakanibacter lacteus]|uniref:DUF1127 domain-containing protein n=1 Tax=Taklimakanibacter lacteus TaxID=2268456 RepID=UPI0013C4FB1A
MISHLSRGFMVEAHDKSLPGLVERIRRHYAKKAVRRQLQSLDDRMLHDIGISRSEIDRIA